MEVGRQRDDLLACLLLVDNRALGPVEELHDVEHRLVEDALRRKDVYGELFIVALAHLGIQMCLNVRNV
jgi:hypothetical protein